MLLVRCKAFINMLPADNNSSSHAEEYNHRDAPPPPQPLEQGQIILVRLLSAISIEEFAENGGGDPSFIHDPSLKSPEWETSVLPAVVLRVNWDEQYRVYHFAVAAIAQWGENSLLPQTTLCVPIISAQPSNHTPQIKQISTYPPWPWKNCFFYTFKRPARFCCLPSQVCHN